MGVQIDIALDCDGNHTFDWRPSDDNRALEVPTPTLQRWQTEHRRFVQAQQRWRAVMEEVDAHLLADG